MWKTAIEVPPKGGFSFDLCRRNEMLFKKGVQPPSYRKTGTTIVGLIFQDGVILGADTRATEGPIVCDKNCEKIHYMAPNIYCCGAGTAADTEAVTDMVSSQLQLHRYHTGRESRVVTALTLLKSHLFNYQGHVQAALVLGGVDVTGPHLHTIYPHGSTDTLPFATMGSGSLAAMAVFESKYREGLTKDEGINLVCEAICSGIFNDLGSGSNVDVCVITKGQKEYLRNHKLLNPRTYVNPKGCSFSKKIEVTNVSNVSTLVIIPEKFAELEEIEKAKQEAQTLESILVTGDRDFVIGKDGAKIPVSDLVGKNILLYFSAHWCGQCRDFLPKLLWTYFINKAKDDAFEVIFISSDKDQASFDEFFSRMPWLALPFGDERKAFLNRTFKVDGIPMLVAIGPTGRTVTTTAIDLIMSHGAEAYPFTDDRIRELEAQFEEMAKGWPRKVKHLLHEKHELVLTREKIYTCTWCAGDGQVWSFSCEECDFRLHPKCADDGDVWSCGCQECDFRLHPKYAL